MTAEELVALVDAAERQGYDTLAPLLDANADSVPDA